MLVVVKANILATRRADLEGERLEFMAVEVFLASVTTDYDCSIKVAKSTLLQQLVYGGDLMSSAFVRHG